MDIWTLTGVSNCLIVLPIIEFGFELSKQQFWDSIQAVTPIWLGKNAIYQHFVLAVVNLIFRIIWVARKVALYTYDIMIYET